MHGSAVSFFLLVIATCYLFLVAHARRPVADDNITASCILKERDALLDLKHGINDTDNLLVSWHRGEDCCRWLGVTCSHRTGNVLRLDLSDATLDYRDMGGEIRPSLLSLEHLEYLDLSAINDWAGPLLNNSRPEFLGSMKNLRHLDLSGGLGFSGSIPPQLANLSKLEYLDLSGASFSVGRVPAELGNLSTLRHLGLAYVQGIYSLNGPLDMSWLTRLRFLEYLDMTYVNLSMVPDDWPHVLNKISSLKVLNLGNCQLPKPNQIVLGHLNLTKIVHLDLSFNYLGHPVTSCWFWNVTTVESLELSKTYLYGPFPASLGRLTSLQSLGFKDNANAATMSVNLKDLCALEHLRLGGSLSQGNIKDLVDKLPHCDTRGTRSRTGNFTSSSLYNLDLSNNHLTGDIPSTIANAIPNLYYLDLSGNNLTGPIPPAIGNATSLGNLFLRSNQLCGQIPILPRNLSVLDVSSNFLSGPLPSDLGASDLRSLVLSSNYITGNIPRSICESQNMFSIDLSNNFLEGPFPQCSRMPGLIFFLLRNNNLSGELPSFLRSSMVVFMDLSWNKFYGTLPPWIGEMENLGFLQLSHNMFYGHIPVSITNLSSLRNLNLASNNISGAIPWSVSNLTAMTGKHPINEIVWFNLYTDGEHEFGGILSLVMKQQELSYGDRIFEVADMDLSLNHLTGVIPDEITSLEGLDNLNLSWNRLSGKIPEKVGAMKFLESLDLSRNNLSGEIPPSLTDLTYLSCLGLSYNSLTGRIPSGRQLDTLYTENPSMYDGNNGLCGTPLIRNCPGSTLPEQRNQKASEKKESAEAMVFYLGLGSGFMVGLWVVFCTLLFNKTWRIAYFRLFDLVCDKAYVFVVVTWGKLVRGTDR